MKFRQNFLVLFLISFIFILITGCSPHNINFVVSDNASLQKLNELVQDRTVMVTTKDSIYSGENIIIKSDSTIVENFGFKPRVIPYFSMREIRYSNGLGTAGIVELKDKQIFKAQDIYIVNIDTIKFNEVITISEIFPTNDLIKIQRRDHLHSALKGLGYGVSIGAVTGAILGTFVGNSGGSPPPEMQNEPVGSNFEGTPRPIIIVFSTIVGGLSGSIIGSVTGAILGQWQDINIQFDKR